MFALTPRDLRTRILDCAGGPSSFNAEMSREGHAVVSCDPIYRFSAGEIHGRIEVVFEPVMDGVRANRGRFSWRKMGSPERLGKLRRSAMETFLEDFPRGLDEGRYVEGGLPELPFDDGAFGLALCSHFLFTYSAQLSEGFHLDSILEMCRVAEEARVFPLLASTVHAVGGEGEASPHLGPVVDGLEERGYEARVERVPYEFQKGGDEMLRVRKRG
ncbi:SAM-dependent methyltransferase [Rubrobacter marinus]|uniref:SAM-dependent methyltransferase n=2 Tax=Rubrobacter marinus TaxID=2653852 RepID=A0A6G8Q312_9ACTN|nr:SAM-dependent methyltransferase [Rubrobacter marinus]